MKQTPIAERHRALGARMVDFAGYEMPLIYTNIQDEHMAVRNAVGVFDVSHMGEFIVKGREALDLVQKVSSNDASKLAVGQAQYSCLPNKSGGIVDDMLVYRLGEDMCAEGEMAFMLVVNASNIEKDWDWIESANTFDTRLINISDETALIAVQGPEATALLQNLTEVELDKIKYYHWAKGTIAGIDNVLISATGYTGAGGFELYVQKDQALELWDAIFAATSPVRPVACGLGARDTLRLEMGFCLYGNDIDDETSPLEAGLGWITKTAKEDFFSKEIFLRQKQEGIQKKLVGFKLNDRRVPRKGYAIQDETGKVIGEVTSGTMSPCLEIPIGMGYVPRERAKIGEEITIDLGRKQVSATIVGLPFYSQENS